MFPINKHLSESYAWILFFEKKTLFPFVILKVLYCDSGITFPVFSILYLRYPSSYYTNVRNASHLIWTLTQAKTLIGTAVLKYRCNSHTFVTRKDTERKQKNVSFFSNIQSRVLESIFYLSLLDGMIWRLHMHVLYKRYSDMRTLGSEDIGFHYWNGMVQNIWQITADWKRYAVYIWYTLLVVLCTDIRNSKYEQNKRATGTIPCLYCISKEILWPGINDCCIRM